MIQSKGLRRSRGRAGRASVLAVSLLALAGGARADFVTVDLTAQVNADARSYSDGGNYPVGGQTLDFAGVPFALALRFAEPTTLGVVQSNGVSAPEVFSFAVGIPDAARVFTLINTGFGAYGAYNGKIEVFGTGGAYASLDLVQGSNLRDHFNGFYQNFISDPTVVPTNFASVRLDRQVLELGPSFAGQSVTEFRFTGGPVASFTDGVPFLAGLTFERVPTPGAASIVGLGLLTAARRRR